MAKHNSLNSLFTSIANAIRTKTETTETINADDFPEKILDITTGTDISDTTATASDVLQGKVFYDADGNKTEGNIIVNSITPSNSAPALAKDSIYKASANGYAINNYDNVSIVMTGGKYIGSPVNAGFLNVPCSGYFYPDKPNINISYYAADRVALSGSNTQKRKLYDISISKTGKLIILGQCNTNCSNGDGYLALYTDSSLTSTSVTKASSNYIGTSGYYSFCIQYDVVAGQKFVLGTNWINNHTNVNWTVYSAYAILTVN